MTNSKANTQAKKVETMTLKDFWKTACPKMTEKQLNDFVKTEG
jgi:hypothetical protein